MNTNKIKRQPVPEGIEVPPHLVYVGNGSEELAKDSDVVGPFLRWSGSDWEDLGYNGSLPRNHYALPVDSPLLAPETHAVNLPAGLPPVPEEGLEAMGWGGIQLDQGDEYFSANEDEPRWHGPLTCCFNETNYSSSRYYLRRPPKAPERVPFDSIKDFGDVFPIWVHTRKGSGWAEGHYIVLSFNKLGGTLWWRDAVDKYSVQDAIDHNARWSTSPLTPWEDCKPFLKEVPK